MSSLAELSLNKTCSTCQRKVKRCLCGVYAKRITSPFEVFIIQDSAEQAHALNTAGIILSSIINSQIQQITDANPITLPKHSTLLFPQQNAWTIPSGCTAVSEERSQTPVLAETLIILDATWNRIPYIFRQIPELTKLPCIQLSNSIEGKYILRKAEHSNQLSTAEAMGYALFGLTQRSEFLMLCIQVENLMKQHILAMGEQVFVRNYADRASFLYYYNQLFKK